MDSVQCLAFSGQCIVFSVEWMQCCVQSRVDSVECIVSGQRSLDSVECLVQSVYGRVHTQKYLHRYRDVCTGWDIRVESLSLFKLGQNKESIQASTAQVQYSTVQLNKSQKATQFTVQYNTVESQQKTSETGLDMFIQEWDPGHTAHYRGLARYGHHIVATRLLFVDT